MAKPVACTLSAGDHRERAARWHVIADESLIAVVPTSAGLRLRFLPDAAGELEQLAELERECCAFAQWSVTPADDEVVLDVTAEGDAIDAVHSMFGGLR